MLILDRDRLVVLLEQMLFRSCYLLLSKLFSPLLCEGSIVWQGLVAKLETSGVFFKRVFLICADALNVRVVLTGQQWDPEKRYQRIYLLCRLSYLCILSSILLNSAQVKLVRYP